MGESFGLTPVGREDLREAEEITALGVGTLGVETHTKAFELSGCRLYTARSGSLSPGEERPLSSVP